MIFNENPICICGHTRDNHWKPDHKTCSGTWKKDALDNLSFPISCQCPTGFFAQPTQNKWCGNFTETFNFRILTDDEILAIKQERARKFKEQQKHETVKNPLEDQFPWIIFDKGIPVLEVFPKIEEDSIFVSIGELLIQHGILKSKREVKDRHTKMVVLVQFAERAHSFFRLWSTRDLMSQFEFQTDDSIIVGNKTVTI